MIAALILAAGASSRFGRPKQLLRFRGKSLLRRTVDCAVAGGCDPVLVVLGARSAALRRELEGSPAQAVMNRSWARGLGTSIRTGTAALIARSPAPEAVLLLACDQPLLTPELVRQLCGTFDRSSARMVACEYAGTVGIPALFAQASFAELLDLDDGAGAKCLLETHAAEVLRVSWPQGALDVDRPEDYEALIAPES